MTTDHTIAEDKVLEHAAKPRAPFGDRIPPRVENAPQPDGASGKRKRTGGELLFDATTYGGFALLGNEVVSTAIVKAAEKPTAFGRFYEKAGELTKKFAPEGMKYAQSGRLNRINFAIIGGFTMVPLIKLLEDNKGKLVRFADRVLHGKQAATDPDMIRAHEEMDNAPKQSWGSLLKGRLLTVVAAWGVDASINWKDGLSARAVKGTKFEPYGSLEAISGRTAERLGNSIGKSRGYSPAQTTNLKGWLSTGFDLFALSSALTVLFYATSKFFAKRSDDRREVYDEIHKPAQNPATTTATATVSTAHAEAADRTDNAEHIPTAAVHAIAHESRLAATPTVGKEA